MAATLTPRQSPRQQLRAQLVDQALAELGQHLEDADRNGPDYVRAYVDAVLAGKHGVRASDLHPQVAALVREIVLDLDVAQRRAA